MLIQNVHQLNLKNLCFLTIVIIKQKILVIKILTIQFFVMFAKFCADDEPVEDYISYS